MELYDEIDPCDEREVFFNFDYADNDNDDAEKDPLEFDVDKSAVKQESFINCKELKNPVDIDLVNNNEALDIKRIKVEDIIIIKSENELLEKEKYSLFCSEFATVQNTEILPKNDSGILKSLLCNDGQTVASTPVNYLQNGLEENNLTDQVFCKQCSKWFISEPDYIEHMKAHDVHVCTICDEVFICLRQFTLHIETHVNDEHYIKEIDYYMCKACNVKFSELIYLVKHVEKRHSDKKMYKCQECNKLFMTIDNLRSHSWSHSNNKPFKCSECYRGFVSMDRLRFHCRTHVKKTPPFKCPKCDKEFSQLGNFNRHIHIHSEDKLLNCSKCHEQFVRRRQYHRCLPKRNNNKNNNKKQKRNHNIKKKKKHNVTLVTRLLTRQQ
ncbi:uncharacterized protein LOC142326341 isoform X2 [Lycorma delicatula]|uniref:uncharacterized protein LOC142326341 isoform X2 n=1 Tax=Lycorma delicatula TaxID=130591 RepID=UPI003F514932